MSGSETFPPAAPLDPIAEQEIALLQQMRQLLASAPNTIAVVASAELPGVQESFPFDPYTRLLIAREPTGGTIAVEEGKWTTVVSANRVRIGGSMVVSGEHPVRLSLHGAGAASTAGKGTLWLGKEGGSWDFRLGNVFWSGAVSAYGLGGATTIEVTEV